VPASTRTTARLTSDTTAVGSPSSPPPAPMVERSSATTLRPDSQRLLPRQTSTPASSATPGRANGAQLDKRLGLPPDGLVLGGSGGLGDGGLRASATEIPKGSYTVTAECVGMLKASLTVSQPGLRRGTTHEVALKCRTTARVKLDLEAGPVSVRITPMTSDPGHTAIAGFWMVPAT
jgi:hypothetical protein